MKKTNRLLALLLTLVMALSLLTGCGAAPASTAPAADPAPEAAPAETTNDNAADLVLKNGVVQTMTSEDDIAQAVAVKDGIITYVGDDAGVEAFIGADTQVIDLEGKYVTPGFIDGHIHDPSPFLNVGKKLDLMYVEVDFEAYKKAVADFVEENPDFEIYLAECMDLKAFPNSVPTKEWLDEICSDKPIMLTDMSGHGKLVNSKVLEMCGVDKDTPDPDGGTIYHDANGELTGYFSDASDLLVGLPTVSYTRDDYVRAYKEFLAQANSYGLTTLDSASSSPVAWDVMSEMDKNGTLPIRFNTNLGLSLGEERQNEALKTLAEAKEKYLSDRIFVEQVKFFIDGVPEGKSAYLLEPYAPGAEMAADYVGTPNCTQEELTAMAIKFNAEGYQFQVHAMGDAGVHMAINAYEESAKVNGNDDLRNKIAHVTLITDEDIVRMGELGIVGAMQPLWFYYDPFFSPLEEQMFGRERFDTEYHIRTMTDAGIVITGSNDYPVTYDYAPLHAMEAGVTQCSPYAGEEGKAEYTRNADQGVTPFEALKWYTVNAAYAMHKEDKLGTIEVGKYGDLTVLGYNLLKCDVQMISDTPVLYTISGGRIVYEG